MTILYSVLTVTSSTTVSTSYDTLYVDATNGSITITLPAITSSGQRYLIKRVDLSTNTCTIVSNGTDTIFNASSQDISSSQVYEIISILGSPNNWVCYLNINV